MKNITWQWFPGLSIHATSGKIWSRLTMHISCNPTHHSIATALALHRIKHNSPEWYKFSHPLGPATKFPCVHNSVWGSALMGLPTSKSRSWQCMELAHGECSHHIHSDGVEIAATAECSCTYADGYQKVSYCSRIIEVALAPNRFLCPMQGVGFFFFYSCRQKRLCVRWSWWALGTRPSLLWPLFRRMPLPSWSCFWQFFNDWGRQSFAGGLLIKSKTTFVSI